MKRIISTVVLCVTAFVVLGAPSIVNQGSKAQPFLAWLRSLFGA